MKKKYYYAVVSFMRNDMENVKAVNSITIVVDNKKGDEGLFPIGELIRTVEAFVRRICIPQTILVENVFEISQRDYEFINERNERYGLDHTVYRNGKKIDEKTKKED